MKYFDDVIRILDRFREPRTETIDTGFRNRKDDKSFQLYEGIRNGTFRTDSIAAATLYEAQSTDNRYTTLKNRLKGRLFNSLFHLNLRRAGFSESAQARYSIKKKAFLADTLLRLGARAAAVRIAQRTLELSRRYEQTDVVLEMALLLRRNASILGKTALYENYDTVVKDALRAFQAEIESSEYFDRVQSILARKGGGRRQYAAQFAEYVGRLSTSLDSTSTFTFRLNYFRLKAIYHAAAGETSELFATADEAISYLRSVPHLAQRAQQGEFLLQKFERYIAVQRFDQAQDIATTFASYFDKGSNNWFSFAELNFLLLMNTLDFETANALYLEVTNHPRFALQSEIVKEHWSIYELYLHYALRRTPGYENTETRKRFDLQRFLSMAPVAARDKHGLNVALLIGHILYMLDAGDFHGIIDRMEALTLYRNRWLRVTDNPRSHLFFKLLRMMENTSFSYTRVLNGGDRYFQELRTLRPEIVHVEEEVQILPYPWLWERILERLRDLKGEGKV